MIRTSRTVRFRLVPETLRTLASPDLRRVQAGVGDVITIAKQTADCDHTYPVTLSHKCEVG